MMYLERPGCNLCMGNQDKAAKGDTVMATPTRQPAVGMPRRGIRISFLGRTPDLAEYKTDVQGIDLTKFAPPIKEMVAN